MLGVDDLSRGNEGAIDALRTLPGGKDRLAFVRMDVRDRPALTDLLRGRRIESAMHFAARAYVEESTRMPLEYHDTNVGGTISTLGACRDAGVTRFVLSSTCLLRRAGADLRRSGRLPTEPIHPTDGPRAPSVCAGLPLWCARDTPSRAAPFDTQRRGLRRGRLLGRTTIPKRT